MTTLRLTTATTGDGAGALSLVLYLVPLLLLGWLWLTARRRQRQAAAVSAALDVGHRVITTSGLVGTLVRRESGMALLAVAPGVVLTFDERALMGEAPGPHAPVPSPGTPQPTGGATADPTAPSKEAD